MRVAIVHDWLYVLGGAEKVLSAIVRCFPSADLYTVFDTLSEKDRLQAALPQSKTTFLQRMPAISRRHRSYLPLMPLAIEQLDLSGYDLIISSSHAVAKGVITGANQLHISYVHSPMRYAWDLQHQSLRDAGLDRGVKGWIARYILFKMRLWDTRTAAGVDTYIANSYFVSRRIRKVYGRDAAVIYPPVTVSQTAPSIEAENPAQAPFFLAASRLVPYKNMFSVVQAFASMPDRRLIVAGSGPELAKLQSIGATNVTFAGFVPDADLRQLMRNARALVFAAEEDFGILPVETQSEGTAVIALGRGGARETVVTSGPTPTGVFFDSPQPDAIAEAVESFDRRRDTFSRSACYANACRFSTDRFERAFTDTVLAEYERFQTRISSGVPTPTMSQPRLDSERPATQRAIASGERKRALPETRLAKDGDYASELSRETV